MNQHEQSVGVRAEWLESVTAQCQIFAGEAVLLCEPDEISDVAAGFSERLTQPASYVERLVLGALLIELAIRWGTLVHAQAHYGKPVQPCAFTATNALDLLCNRAPERHYGSSRGRARSLSTSCERTPPRPPNASARSSGRPTGNR